MVTIFHFFGYASMVSVLPALILAFRRTGQPTFQLRILLSCSLLADVLGLVLSYTVKNSTLVSNVFLWIQFSVCALILIEGGAKTIYRVVWGLIVVYLALTIGNIAVVMRPFEFYSGLNGLAGMVIFMLAIRFYYLLARDLPTPFLDRFPMFWIAMAITFYYGGNVFLFLLNNFLLKLGADVHMGYWLIHSVLNTVKNVLFAIGLWKISTGRS